MIVLFAKIMEINGTVAFDARLLSGSMNRQLQVCGDELLGFAKQRKALNQGTTTSFNTVQVQISIKGCRSPLFC